VKQPGPFGIELPLSGLSSRDGAELTLADPGGARDGRSAPPALTVGDARLVRLDRRSARSFAELGASTDPRWFPARIDELAAMPYADAKAALLWLGLRGDLRAAPALAAHVLTTRLPGHQFTGMVTEYLHGVGPRAAPWVYDLIARTADLEAKLKLVWLLNDRWNFVYCQRLLTDPEPRVRLYAAAKIGIMRGDDDLVALPLSLLDTATGMTLADACWCIGKFERPEAWPRAYAPTVRLLAHPDPQVVKQAYHALSNIRQAPAFALVRQALADPRLRNHDPDIRDNLYATIGRLRNPDHQQLLIAALARESDPYLEVILLDFIGQPPTTESVSLLRRLATSPGPDYRRYYAIRNAFGLPRHFDRQFFIELRRRETSALIALQLDRLLGSP
jgi:hypothetical protein